jgi:hypothetical protein
MSKTPIKTVPAIYNRKTKTLTVQAKSEEVLPEYMKYYITFLGLPIDTKVVYALDKKKN